jgi:hypothetical protein
MTVKVLLLRDPFCHFYEMSSVSRKSLTQDNFSVVAAIGFRSFKLAGGKKLIYSARFR